MNGRQSSDRQTNWAITNLATRLTSGQLDDMSRVPLTRLHTIGDRAFPAASTKAWNSLPAEVTSARSLQTFKSKLKTHLFCLILVIFLLDLLLYCKVTEVRCIFHFNCMYVCMYVCVRVKMCERL